MNKKIIYVVNKWPVLLSFGTWFVIVSIYYALSLSSVSNQTNGQKSTGQNRTNWRDITSKDQFVVTSKEQLVFSSASFALAVAMIWNGFAAGAIILKSWPHTSRFRRSVFIKIAIIEVILVFSIFLYLKSHTVGGSFVEAGIESIQGLPVRICKYLDYLLLVSNCLVAVMIVLTTNAILLVTISTKSCLDLETRINRVSRRINYYQTLLYSSSALLIIGVVEIISLIKWEAVTLGNQHNQAVSESVSFGAFGMFKVSSSPSASDLTNSYLSVADGLGFAAGIAYTMLLLMLYLPAGMILQRELSQLTSESVRNISTEFELQKWQIKNKISSSPLATFTGYFALLGPLIVGILSKIFSPL